MALTAYEVIKIIGKRQGQATYDVVEIVPDSNSFHMQNPLLNVPIPTTGNTVAVVTKLINLRAFTRLVAISGSIWESSAMAIADSSAMGVTFNDSTGVITGGTPVTSLLKKKWILEQIALGNGSGGEAVTMQWRGVIAKAANPPVDETYNEYHKQVIFTMLKFDDSATATAMVADANSRTVPEFMKVTMSLMWGIPQQ